MTALEAVRAARAELGKLKLELQQRRLAGDVPGGFCTEVLEKVAACDAALYVAERALLATRLTDQLLSAGASEASTGAPVGTVPEAIRDALAAARERIAVEPAFESPPCPVCGACSKRVEFSSALSPIGATELRCTKCDRSFFSEVTE